MEPVGPVAMTEKSPLIASNKKLNAQANGPYREPIPCSFQVANVVANMFTCGTNRKHHEQAFIQAVSHQQLEAAKNHYRHGAHIDLSKPAVQTVLHGSDRSFTGFLAVNADRGSHRQAFKTLLDEGYHDMAVEMLWSAPMESKERVQLFRDALNSQIADRVETRLGAHAAKIIRTWHAIVTNDLCTLIKQIAAKETAWPYSVLTYQATYELKWVGGNVGFELLPKEEKSWCSETRDYWNLWTTSLLYEAIIHANKPLVENIINNMRYYPTWLVLDWTLEAINLAESMDQKTKKWMERTFNEEFSFINRIY